VVGPGHQDLVADADSQDDVLVGVGQADASRSLFRVLTFTAGPAVEPDAEQHLEPDLLTPDDFQNVLGVPVPSVEPDQLPIPLQDLEIFENLRLSRESIQLRVLARAVAGVADAVAVPFLHGQIGCQRRRQPSEDANEQPKKPCPHASISPRRAFRSCSIFTIRPSSSG
jgi:hypothetical protein